MVKVSPSTIVITVSRCMNARRCGSASATIRVAALRAKRLFASRSTPCGVVRSLIPISTTPRPSTSMSPPSAVAGPLADPGVHTSKTSPSNSGCHW